MAVNDRTPAGANGEGSGKSVCLAADTFQIASTPAQVQIARLQKRFDFSPSVAAAVAALAYPQADTWGARA